MVNFGGKIGTLYQMLKNAFKKHPLQNRTNVQIKGGGGQRPFEQCSKKLHFFEMRASLSQHNHFLFHFVKEHFVGGRRSSDQKHFGQKSSDKNTLNGSTCLVTSQHSKDGR